MQEEILY